MRRMNDPARKARADRYRLKLMERYLELRHAPDELLDRHQNELHELLDNMGYFESLEQNDAESEPTEVKPKQTLLC